jgi:hypothetical protein
MNERRVTLGEVALLATFVAFVSGGLTHAYDTRPLASYLGEPSPLPPDFPPLTVVRAGSVHGREPSPLPPDFPPLTVVRAGSVHGRGPSPKMPVYPPPDEWSDEKAMDAGDVVDYVNLTKLPACPTRYEWDAATVPSGSDGALSFTCPYVATYVSSLPKPFGGDCEPLPGETGAVYVPGPVPTGDYGITCNVWTDDVTHKAEIGETMEGAR